MSENREPTAAELKQATESFHKSATEYAKNLIEMMAISGFVPKFRMMVGIHIAASAGVLGYNRADFLSVAASWFDRYTAEWNEHQKAIEQRGPAN